MSQIGNDESMLPPEKLQKRIANDIPGLKEAIKSKDDLKSTDLLREWAYSIAHFANMKTILELGIPEWKIQIKNPSNRKNLLG